MKRRSPRLFFLLLLLQTMFLIGIAASYYAVDVVGEELRLKTAPVDPRDLFYGDYVELAYEIGSLPWTVWKGNERPEGKQNVYVVLRREGVYDRAIAVYPNKPETKSGETVLQARVRDWGEMNSLNLTYGFERYYVEENTGKAIEERRELATIIVKVAPWGQARVTNLVFADKK
jgi:uncharacterized membrane-anchored protein